MRATGTAEQGASFDRTGDQNQGMITGVPTGSTGHENRPDG